MAISSQAGVARLAKSATFATQTSSFQPPVWCVLKPGAQAVSRTSWYPRPGLHNHQAVARNHVIGVSLVIQSQLFASVQLTDQLRLKNRIVLAPLYYEWEFGSRAFMRFFEARAEGGVALAMVPVPTHGGLCD